MAHAWSESSAHGSGNEEIGTPHLQATHGTLQKGFLYPLTISNTASFTLSPQVRARLQQHDLLLDLLVRLPKDLQAPRQRAKMGAVQESLI